MDMGSLLGTILRTLLNHKRDPYVHPQTSLGIGNIDHSSCRLIEKRPNSFPKHISWEQDVDFVIAWHRFSAEEKGSFTHLQGLSKYFLFPKIGGFSGGM